MMGGDIAKNPLALMSILGDDAGKLKELLPLMAMSGGKPLDPVTMMMMTGENSSMKDLLPLLAMQGGVDLQNNPMALMALIDGDTLPLLAMLPFMAMNGQNGLDKNK